MTETEVEIRENEDHPPQLDHPKLKYGALRKVEFPEQLIAPNGAVLTKGEWLVLTAIGYYREQTGLPDPTVKTLAHILGWSRFHRTPWAVILRVRRLEAKGVLVTTRQFEDDVVLPDHYDIVGDVPHE